MRADSRPNYYMTAQPYDAASPAAIEAIYRAVLGDAIARHRRMCGFDAAYLLPHYSSSLATPASSLGAAAAASSAAPYADAFAPLGVRATLTQDAGARNHALAVAAMLRRTMHISHAAIYKGPYTGRWCPHDSIDVSDSQAPANCPRCGRPAEIVNEQRYFFRLPSFRSRLDALYQYRPEFIQPPARLNDAVQFAASEMKDVPISIPDARGGIPWPDDPAQAVAPVYSYPLLYLSAIGFTEDADGDEFRANWPAKGHLIGRSAFVQHAVYWPAFLMAADLPLPRRVFTHAAVQFTAGATTDEFLQLASGANFAGDAARLLLLRDVQYVSDSVVELRALAGGDAAQSVDALEKITRRVLELVRQQADGKVPPAAVLGLDSSLEISFADLRAEVRILLDANNFSAAIAKIWAFVESLEAHLGLIAAQSRAARTGDARVRGMIHDACQALGWVALLMHPMIPRITEAIWRALGQTTRLSEQLIDETPWTCVMPGKQVGEFRAP